MEYNSYLNLSAIRTPEDIYTKHICDTLELNTCDVFKPWKTCIDLGTGGGFPLIPLALTNSWVQFVGIDARRKKINAVEAMLERLHIDNATVLRTRAEDHKKRYDIVVARSVAYAHDLFDLCRRVCRPGGTICRYKVFTYEEDTDVRELCHVFKCTLRTHTYTLPETDQQRILYLIRVP